MGILANSKAQLKAAAKGSILSQTRLYTKLNKISSGTEVHHNLKTPTYNPLKHITDDPIFIVVMYLYSREFIF